MIKSIFTVSNLVTFVKHFYLLGFFSSNLNTRNKHLLALNFTLFGNLPCKNLWFIKRILVPCFSVWKLIVFNWGFDRSVLRIRSCNRYKEYQSFTLFQKYNNIVLIITQVKIWRVSLRIGHSMTIYGVPSCVYSRVKLRIFWGSSCVYSTVKSVDDNV